LSVYFKVCKSVQHRSIQINQPTRCSNFSSLLLDVYVWLNMFRAPPRPSSGAYSFTSSLWFYRRSVVVAVLLVVVVPAGPTTTRIRMEHPDPARKLSANLYDIYHCCVYSEKLLTLDKGTVRNM